MNDAVAIFRRLAVKQHVLLGGLTGSRAQEFNVALKAWLAGPGTMLDIDHVELRRWLVDTRLWTRDGYGRAYARGTPPAALASVVAALDAVDLDAEARRARAALAQEREARRALHAPGKANPA